CLVSSCIRSQIVNGRHLALHSFPTRRSSDLSDIGIKAVLLLQKLGYGVVLAPLKESGRSQLSKGFVRQAAVIARHNMMKLKGRVDRKSTRLNSSHVKISYAVF